MFSRGGGKFFLKLGYFGLVELDFVFDFVSFALDSFDFLLVRLYFALKLLLLINQWTDLLSDLFPLLPEFFSALSHLHLQLFELVFLGNFLFLPFSMTLFKLRQVLFTLCGFLNGLLLAFLELKDGIFDLLNLC